MKSNIYCKYVKFIVSSSIQASICSSLIFLSPIAKAAPMADDDSEYLIQSGDVGNEDYEKALKKGTWRPLIEAWKRFTDYHRMNLDLDRALSLADQSSCTEAINLIKEPLVAQNDYPMSSKDREMFQFFFLKLSEICNGNSRLEAQKEYRKYQVSEISRFSGAASSFTKEIQKMEAEQNGEILVSGVAWYKIAANSKELFQWTLLTNKTNPLVVYASWKDFVSKIREQVPLVRGKCGRQQPRGLLPEVWGRSSVFFGPNCVLEIRLISQEEGITPSPYKNMYKKDSNSWLWPTLITIVVVGAGAYYMKDKRLTIEGLGTK